MTIPIIIFVVSVFIVFYAMVGYPLVLMLLDKTMKLGPIKRLSNYQPTVTCLIVAHNEEKVIEQKLENVLLLDYPANKLEIVVTSDYSTDRTNKIVNDFIERHPERRLRLYCSKERKGKTNAQNEAQKTIHSEILVMTDANAMLKSDAITRLVECFGSDKIAYVCGKLIYTNSAESLTSDSESTYWNLDLRMRDIESRIDTITAGNGAIYACRNCEYHNFDPISCHDGAMPCYYASKGMKALFATDAIAYEKAGAVNTDEFKRKVRMNRGLLKRLFGDWGYLNVFAYGWFSFFYFGHRMCRHYLGVCHFFAFLSTILMVVGGSLFGAILAMIQFSGLIIVLYQIHHTISNKFFRMIGYYGMTVIAQYVAIWKSITGKQKAVWEKAESTR